MPGPPKSRHCVAAPALALLLAAPEVVGHIRRVLVGGRQRRVVRAEEGDHRVAEVGERHVEPARLVALLVVAAPLAARTDADHVDRAVADAVVAVARRSSRPGTSSCRGSATCGPRRSPRCRPRGRPTRRAGGRGRACSRRCSRERRARRGPTSPRSCPCSSPSAATSIRPQRRPVELRAVGVLREGHAHQRAVGRVAPAVVGAHELDGVALVVAADLHAAVAARVQEDVDAARRGRGRG